MTKLTRKAKAAMIERLADMMVFRQIEQNPEYKHGFSMKFEGQIDTLRTIGVAQETIDELRKAAWVKAEPRIEDVKLERATAA